ncbi:OmpA family protein [Ostreiculturibacter nitratireducens]|uniref:OmpA family protein n=1 Tax=Ostreiculturibacter nitratireducens TaxID=3075226 RepID=UPI0031B58AFA
MRIAIPVVLTGALALSACTDTYGSGQPSNAQSGAVAGAVIGGLIGAQSDDDRLAKTAAGAIIGGAIGGAIGTQLDRQRRDLERDISNDQVRIQNTGRELIVTMPEGILFATDSAAVRSDLRGDLYALADNLNQYPNSTIEIVGHTDNTGSAAYNQDLSERRAAAVGAILRNGGVSGGRIVTYGRGESQPVASNLTPEGRTLNRRVEIIIRPNA